MCMEICFKVIVLGCLGAKPVTYAGQFWQGTKEHLNVAHYLHGFVFACVILHFSKVEKFSWYFTWMSYVKI